MTRIIEEAEKMPEAEAWARRAVTAAENRMEELGDIVTELEAETGDSVKAALEENLIRARGQVLRELETVVTHGNEDQVAWARDHLKRFQLEHLARGAYGVLEVYAAHTFKKAGKEPEEGFEEELKRSAELVAIELYEKVPESQRWGARNRR